MWSRLVQIATICVVVSASRLNDGQAALSSSAGQATALITRNANCANMKVATGKRLTNKCAECSIQCTQGLSVLLPGNVEAQMWRAEEKKKEKEKADARAAHARALLNEEGLFGMYNYDGDGEDSPDSREQPNSEESDDHDDSYIMYRADCETCTEHKINIPIHNYYCDQVNKFCSPTTTAAVVLCADNVTDGRTCKPKWQYLEDQGVDVSKILNWLDQTGRFW